MGIETGQIKIEDRLARFNRNYFAMSADPLQHVIIPPSLFDFRQEASLRRWGRHIFCKILDILQPKEIPTNVKDLHRLVLSKQNNRAAYLFNLLLEKALVPLDKIDCGISKYKIPRRNPLHQES